MDVVEAVDAWIDEQIDELTDDELEIILEMLDAVSASSLAHVEVENLYDEDIDILVGLTGGSAQDRVYSNRVLRAALFGESPSATTVDNELTADELDNFDHDEDDDVSDDDEFETDALEDDEFDHDNELDEITLGPATGDEFDNYNEDGSDQFDGDSDDHDLETDALEDDEFDHDDELDEITLGPAADDEFDHDNEFDDHDLESDEFEDAEFEDAEDDRLEAATAIRPVELREFDELGPSFLPEVSSTSDRYRDTSRRRLADVLLPAFLIVGLAVFAFGMVQLINSLNAEDTTEVAPTGDDAAATAIPEPTPEATRPPGPTATVDPLAPTPTPTPEPTPMPRVGIRLGTGDIMLASFVGTGIPPEITKLYDASDEDLEPARQIIWLDDALAVINSDGNVFVIDPDARRPQPTTVYDVESGFGEAVKIASSDDQIAVLTEDGNISLTPSDGRADPDAVQVVWDALEQGARATDIAAVNSLVPFVLEDGNAQMILTDSNNALVPIWSAEDQPQAFNVGGSEAGILLGVGQGAVARYNLDPGEDDQLLESVWDPFSREDAPAIGYSSLGEDTLIVTGNGAVVLSNGDGGGPLLWDPETTELRAFAALAGDTHVVVLLETGSVVRVPVDPDALIESIWDITDETLSPASQIAVESLSN